MTTKNRMKTTILGLIAVVLISTLGGSNFAFSEEGYTMAENTQATLTFTFRDGVETHQFPVFKMTSDFVNNAGTTFEIEGIVGTSPFLHKALDEAYKYRVMTSTGGSSFEFDYRFFDVDVDLSKNGDTIRTLHYYNCEILDYETNTLDSSDYESYFSSKSGFAVVDNIEFRCGGIRTDSSNSPTSTIDYSEIYDFAENVRTFITFEFDGGTEKIEFTGFELNSGFKESSDAVVPSFSVEGVVNNYPLLYKAIDNARKVSGLSTSFNTDFDALVEFSNGEKTLRALDFRDCRVSGAIINTEYDKEEGFTGKSGFALVNEIDFDCAGLTPLNESYSALLKEYPNSKTTFLENTQSNEGLHMADGVRVMGTFTYNNGIENLEFPIFRQVKVLDTANPTFELEGIVGDYPLLYKKVDENLKLQSVSGANPMIELFDIDLNLVNGEIIRGFNYSNCRVIDYDIGSDMNKEETYIKGTFALENTFEFECQGYHPNNPLYDAMFNSVQKAKTTSTSDLRNTDKWGPGFYVK